jgi:hypothetical protein
MDVIDVSTVVIDHSSDLVLDSKVTYTFSFVIGNPISVGGFIQMTTPKDLVLDITNLSNSCKISINSSNFVPTHCTASADGHFINFTTPASNSNISEGSNISLQILKSFTNPTTTQPVANFTIKTYYGDSYAIEQTND